MANDPIPTTPPPPQVPRWIIVVLTILAGTVTSPFFHTVLTATLAALGTVYYAKHVLPSPVSLLGDKLPSSALVKPKRAYEAIGRLQFGNVGCTGTIIGPVQATDLEIEILTAAHCVKLGGVGSMTLKDGRMFSVKCVARDADSDAAWLTAENPGGDVPYLLLADGLPNNGEIVWHQGYGIDRPGNRESGVFKGMRDNGTQCHFRLSVSPGDSGGGIILDTDSRVVSPVCCTNRLGDMGDVFGATPMAVSRIRPHKTASRAEPPLLYPVLPLPYDDATWTFQTTDSNGKITLWMR